MKEITELNYRKPKSSNFIPGLLKDDKFGNITNLIIYIYTLSL
jgi:hypothetical protein